MPEVRLQYGDKEFLMGAGVTTIGRTEDNFISFPEDSNVSRYHAEIESRGTEYCLIDLNSSNGTTVNDNRVSGEVYLKDGDVIVCGGTSTINFVAIKEPTNADTDKAEELAPDVADEPPAVPTEPKSDVAAASSVGSGKLLLIAGVICCVAILFVAVAVGVYYFSGSSCSATAAITSPDDRSVIDKSTEIEINLKNGSCVAQVIYTVNGTPFASSTEPPFTTAINPGSFPDLADGQDHALGLILVDRQGNQMPQASPIFLGFETRRLKAPEQEPIIVTGPTEPSQPTTKEISLIEMSQLAGGLAKQLSGGRPYNVSNPQFLKEVQKRTAEYSKDGYFAKASKYRDAINVAYVREQNLDAQLGYLLAMSRSGFDPAKKGSEEGLWRMTNDFVTSNKYNGLCGSETIGDPAQNCAAKASALYMKAIVLGVFEGDMLYGVAAFGKSTSDAAIWKASLPADRSDVWNAIRTAPEREQLIRFFAAGIVSENPQRFGLKNDRPLSELYRLTM